MGVGTSVGPLALAGLDEAPGQADVLYLEDLLEIRRGYIDPPNTKMRSSGSNPPDG